MKQKKVYTGKKFLTNKTMTETEKRRLFDFKHVQLELRRKDLENRIAREEFEAKLQANTRKMMKRAKKAAKRAAYDVKYAYVFGGHAKNELLGFLTFFNANKSRNVRTTRFVHYDNSDKRMYLNIYERKDRDKSEKAKVFVYIHGGGWIGGYPGTREGFTTRIAEKGYFVASIYYGEAPMYSHPRMIENVYKAFAWLKDHAEEYNIDMDEIFVGGESAGAHLSAMAGAISTNPEYNALFDLDERSRRQKIKGLVLNCGVYDMEKATTTGFKNIGVYTQSYCGGVEVKDLDDDMKKQISPIYWVTKDFPPTFAISGENDKLAVLTFDFVKRLYDDGVKLEHYHAQGKYAVHAFAVVQALHITKIAMAGIYEFLADLSR
ncbi:MAG: alpha/beta hydrolase [Clostridia bacterium]|nr:alpha/beta hydrolase [Clostridia bacterium]